MKIRLLSVLFIGPLLIILFIQACSSKITVPTPSTPPPAATNTPSNSPTHTPVNTPNPGSPTNSPTNSPSPSPTLTPTTTPTLTPTNTPQPTITNTPTTTLSPTPTGTWFTSTPTRTGTACWTATPTLTGTAPPQPTHYIGGTLTYSGTGTVDATHNLYVAGGAPAWIFGLSQMEAGGFEILSSGGSYILGTEFTGTYQLSAYFDYNGINNTSPLIQNSWLYLRHVPGMRYTTSGACTIPATVATYPVTVIGAAGTTDTGPSLTFDDTCSYWGIFGTAAYTGTRGTMGLCRSIFITAFTDASYTTQVQQTRNFSNGDTYYFVTNDVSGNTGLTPLYLRAWFDANGDYVFDTGDPYLDLGLVTPTTNGLLQNISFGDTYIQ